MKKPAGCLIGIPIRINEVRGPLLFFGVYLRIAATYRGWASEILMGCLKVKALVSVHHCPRLSYNSDGVPYGVPHFRIPNPFILPYINLLNHH